MNRDVRYHTPVLQDSHIPTKLIQEPPRPIAIYVPVGSWRFWLIQFLPRLVFVLALLASRRLTGRPSRASVALQLRMLFESLSGLWIKAGQILALRRDLIPKEYADELADLQFRTAGFSPDEAIQIIERELGKPLEELFSDFDREPLGAASLAQTHLARLKGTAIPVAVKVLRPTVEHDLAVSFQRIRLVVNLFVRFGVAPYFRWNELLLELKQTLDEELDYRIEATSLRIFRKHLKRDQIYVPRVFRRLSSRRVLTMEFIQGVFMTEYIRACDEQPARVAQWQAENNVQPEKVARRLTQSYLRQLFEDNLFHADLHPGNIILLRDSRIALIDFGSIGFLEGEFLLMYQYFLEAITDRKYGKAADLIFLISNALPALDLSDVKNQIMLAFRAWETRSRSEELPYDEKSLANAVQEMFVFLLQKRITLAASFLRVFRCELTLDASLKYPRPGARLHEAHAPLFPADAGAAVSARHRAEGAARSRRPRGRGRHRRLARLRRGLPPLLDAPAAQCPGVQRDDVESGGVLGVGAQPGDLGLRAGGPVPGDGVPPDRRGRPHLRHPASLGGLPSSRRFGLAVAGAGDCRHGDLAHRAPHGPAPRRSGESRGAGPRAPVSGGAQVVPSV